MANVFKRSVLLQLVCACTLGNFVTAQSTFTVRPMSVTQAEGLEAVFECLYSSDAFYGWFINGTFQRDIPPGIVAVLPSGDSPARLTIPAIPQYNNTVVQCEAAVRVGGRLEGVLSENATLKVHGISVIDESVNNAIRVSWADQNFTTDITFCVDVVQLFGANDTSLHISSVCGLNVTQYTLQFPPHGPCDRFNVTIIPAESVMNGTSSEPFTGFFSGAHAPQNVVIACDDKGESSQLCQLSGSDESSLAGVCRFVVNFTSNDDSVLPMISDSMMIDGNGNNDYVFHVDIATNRKYSIKAEILVRETTTILPPQNLTTHDIVSAEASVLTDAIVTSCTFSEGSNATGYLAIVTSKNCSSEMADAIFFTEYNIKNEPSTLDGVGEGDYNVAFFDLESNGLPSYSRTTNINDVYIGAASVRGVTVPSGARNDTFHGITDTRSVNSTVLVNGDNQICIRCSTECLALVYSCNNIDVTVSVIVSGGESDCIGPLPNGFYSVALFSLINQSAGLHTLSGKQMSLIINTFELSAASSTTEHPTTTDSLPGYTGLDNFPMWIIAGVVIIVLFLVVVIISITLCAIRIKLKKDEHIAVPIVDGRVDWSTTFAGIEQPNEAYSLVLRKNAAYEKTKPRNQQTNNSQIQTQVSVHQEEIIERGRDHEQVPEYEEIFPQSRVQAPGQTLNAEVVPVVYENTTPKSAECLHQYEEVLPQSGVTNTCVTNVLINFNS